MERYYRKKNYYETFNQLKTVLFFKLKRVNNNDKINRENIINHNYRVK